MVSFKLVYDRETGKPKGKSSLKIFIMIVVHIFFMWNFEETNLIFIYWHNRITVFASSRYYIVGVVVAPRVVPH